MRSIPKKIEQKLTERKADNALRKLGENSSLIDFSSNDYLGFSRSEEVFDQAHHLLAENEIKRNGATGSRLLSGNHPLYEEVEKLLCSFHESEAALIFNSGYDANIGFFSSIPQRGDVILYDEFVHASIRDGIQMSNARSYKFRHNDIKDLEHKSQSEFSRNLDNSEIYIVTESVFSMDGDSPDIKRISQLCKDVGAYLIVDEAHALGVFGENGQALVQSLGFEKAIFARIVTFGKALGCHGAAILGSNILKQYLINFCRSFIYTTALPPHSLATIDTAYQHLVGSNGAKNLKKLQENIHYFKSEVTRLDLNFIESSSAIHCCVIPGNKNVKSVAEKLQQNGYDVKPILSPTVPTGKERLRFCLHAYNSQEEITKVLGLLKEYIH